mmetsp:Transcript_43726/g.103932  ORF Transcript_43726/g.103932 Transcript_43726/m.103932 type:complete len:465 (+) Transcript_43726:3067-4461(+)
MVPLAPRIVPRRILQARARPVGVPVRLEPVASVDPRHAEHVDARGVDVGFRALLGLLGEVAFVVLEHLLVREGFVPHLDLHDLRVGHCGARALEEVQLLRGERHRAVRDRVARRARVAIDGEGDVPARDARDPEGVEGVIREVLHALDPGGDRLEGQLVVHDEQPAVVVVPAVRADDPECLLLPRRNLLRAARAPHPRLDDDRVLVLVRHALALLERQLPVAVRGVAARGGDRGPGAERFEARAVGLRRERFRQVVLQVRARAVRLAEDETHLACDVASLEVHAHVTRLDGEVKVDDILRVVVNRPRVHLAALDLGPRLGIVRHLEEHLLHHIPRPVIPAHDHPGHLRHLGDIDLQPVAVVPVAPIGGLVTPATLVEPGGPVVVLTHGVVPGNRRRAEQVAARTVLDRRRAPRRLLGGRAARILRHLCGRERLVPHADALDVPRRVLPRLPAEERGVCRVELET